MTIPKSWNPAHVGDTDECILGVSGGKGCAREINLHMKYNDVDSKEQEISFPMLSVPCIKKGGGNAIKTECSKLARMEWAADSPGVIEVSNSASTLTLTFRLEEDDKENPVGGANDKVFDNRNIAIDLNDLNHVVSKAYTFSITSGDAAGTEFGIFARLYSPCVSTGKGTGVVTGPCVGVDGACVDRAGFNCDGKRFIDDASLYPEDAGADIRCCPLPGVPKSFTTVAKLITTTTSTTTTSTTTGTATTTTTATVTTRLTTTISGVLPTGSSIKTASSTATTSVETTSVTTTYLNRPTNIDKTSAVIPTKVGNNGSSNGSNGEYDNGDNRNQPDASSSSGLRAGYIVVIVILVLLLLLVVSIYACAHCKAQTEREIPTSRAVMNAVYDGSQRDGGASAAIAGTDEYAGFPMEDGNNVYNLGPRTPHRRNTTTLYAIPVEDDSVATSAGSAASGRARAATSTGTVVYVSTPNQNDPTYAAATAARRAAATASGGGGSGGGAGNKTKIVQVYGDAQNSDDDDGGTGVGGGAAVTAALYTIVGRPPAGNTGQPLYRPVYDVTGGANTSSSANTMPSAHEAEYAGLSGGGSPAKVGNTGQPLYRPVYDLTGGTTTTGTSASQPSAHEAAYAGFNGDGGGNECAYYDADPVTETSPYATPVDVDSSGNSGGSSA